MLWITNINRRPSEVGWQGPYEDAQGAMTLGRFDIQFPTNQMASYASMPRQEREEKMHQDLLATLSTMRRDELNSIRRQIQSEDINFPSQTERLDGSVSQRNGSGTRRGSSKYKQEVMEANHHC
jgi:hypothetical protein